MAGINIKDFVEVAKYLPITTSVLVRGDHGIGKSQVIRQIASHFNLDVVDRRLSQMCEGDMIGLPVITDNSTKFNPPDWFIDCCRNARVLFLDEINRATPEILQAAFQIVLDRELNGVKLHPKTRVYAAVNSGNKYTVNDMDPALLDRFWVADIEPSVEDWLSWAEKNIHATVYEFIQDTPKFLDAPDNFQPNSIQSSRRSWERVSNALVNAGIIDEPQHPVFFNLVAGYVGFEAAAAFYNFAKNINSQVSGEDIVERYTQSNIQNKIKKLGQENLNICIDKVVNHIKNFDTLTENQKTNINKLMESLPSELRLSFWSKVTSLEKVSLIKDFHNCVVNLIIEIFQNEEEENKVLAAASESEKK